MMEAMRNLQIVLSVVVICIVQAMAQVCPYSDPRCTCDPPSVTCYSLDKIPPLNTGVNVSQISDLWFQNGNITSIFDNSLPSGLTSLHFFYVPLTNISEDAFEASAATLQSLYFSRAHFSNLPTALKKLTKLISLQLQDTPIRGWDVATLKQLTTTLESLELSGGGLTAWPSWISDFQLLRSIDLSRNTFKYIPDDAFSSIKAVLTYLDLSSTGLTQVPQALSTLLCLDTLFLSNNDFTDVSQIQNIIESPFAQKLSYLNLDSIGLTRVANFSYLTSLRILSLSYNRISDIPTGSLPTSLTILHFSDNSLSNVPTDVASMYRLYTLDLSGNSISKIESNSFPSSLKNLIFRSNNLTIITNTTFRNLNLLRYLSLDSNPISTIEPEAFSDLVSLQSLSISDTQLTEIPLALTSLSSKLDITLDTNQPLACPCPAPNELVKWFTSLENFGFIEATCSNGQSVRSYLSGQCGPTSAAP